MKVIAKKNRRLKTEDFIINEVCIFELEVVNFSVNDLYVCLMFSNVD